MAEKILQTRILNKVDTLEAWNSSSLKLKKGELAFATVAASAGTGLSEPVVMVKIGTEEEKTFAELPWAFHAKSSDVLAACKSADALTAFVNGVIANAGIATNSAMQELAGKVTTAEGKITTLEGKMTTAEGAIDALEALVGDKKVATQISEAINALNLADTYAAKTHTHAIADVTGLSDSIAAAKKAGDDAAEALGEYKTLNDAAVKVNSDAVAAMKKDATITTFKGIEEALAGKQAAGDYATKTEAQGYANAKDAAIQAAQKAGDDAQADVDALAGKVGEVAEGKTIVQMISDAQTAATYDDTDVKADISALETKVGETPVAEQISTAIANEKLAETYAAKVHKHVKADITDFAHNHEMSEVNGLVDALAGKQAAGDYATKAEAQGYANAKDAAIEAAQAAADKAQEEVDALEIYVGTIPEGYTETNVIAYINKKAQETLDTASGGSSESAASVLAALNTYKAENDPKVTANSEAIADLEELVGDKKVSDAIAAAVKVEKERAEGIEGGLETRLAAVEANYATDADVAGLQTQINTIMNNPDAEGAINSINEFTTYVAEHGTIADGMRTDINKNKDDIAAMDTAYKAADTALSGRIDTLEAIDHDAYVAADTALETKLNTEIGKKAAQTDLDNAVARIETAEGKITTLEGEMDDAEGRLDALEGLTGGTKVSDAITAVTNPMSEKITALEGKAHEHANKAELDKFVDGDKAKLDSAVQTVTAAATSGLKATRDGNDIAIEIDDTVTFIFDCGTSAV